MAKWEISKEFEFDYAHRVWTQTLNEKLALTTCTKCRWPHGHRGKVVISLEANNLKDGMVMDFVELNWFKKFVDDVIDHKCLLDLNDPSIPIFYPKLKVFDPTVSESLDRHFYYDQEGDYYKIHPAIYSGLTAHEIEIYQGLVFIDFIPTSENLAKWFFDIVQNALTGIAKVSKIEFDETPKSKSIYYG